MPIVASDGIILNSIVGSSDTAGWIVNASFQNEGDGPVYGRRLEGYCRSEGGGVWDAAHNHIFSGHLVPNTLVFDRKQSTWEVQLATSHWYLNIVGLQGIYMTEQAIPANNHQETDLTLGSVVKHMVDEHTQITTFHADGFVDTSNVDTVNSTAIEVIKVRQSNSILQAIRQIAQFEFFVVYFDKLNNLHYTFHPQYISPLPDSVLHITEDMLIDQPQVTYRNEVQVDQINLYALTDDGDILNSDYPATIASDGRRHKISNIRCNDQTRLDVLAERAYKWMSREITVTIRLHGPWGLWLEMYERVGITYSGTAKNDLLNILTWSNKKFWIKTISVERIGNSGAITELVLEEENV